MKLQPTSIGAKHFSGVCLLFSAYITRGCVLYIHQSAASYSSLLTWRAVFTSLGRVCRWLLSPRKGKTWTTLLRKSIRRRGSAFRGLLFCMMGWQPPCTVLGSTVTIKRRHQEDLSGLVAPLNRSRSWSAMASERYQCRANVSINQTTKSRDQFQDEVTGAISY